MCAYALRTPTPHPGETNIRIFGLENSKPMLPNTLIHSMHNTNTVNTESKSNLYLNFLRLRLMFKVVAQLQGAAQFSSIHDEKPIRRKCYIQFVPSRLIQ